MKKKRKALPRNYDAKKGSRRERLLRQANKLYTQGKLKEAIKLREAMEAMERGKKTTKRKKASTRKGQSVNARLRAKAKGNKWTPAQLRKVYNRGLAAWISSGSRKGMTAHQWAMARVNSFLRGGPARKVDAPMFKKKRKKK